jgi:hypothetical protein
MTDWRWQIHGKCTSKATLAPLHHNYRAFRMHWVWEEQALTSTKDINRKMTSQEQ